jgi:hypothetical protein
MQLDLNALSEQRPRHDQPSLEVIFVVAALDRR